MRPRPPILDRAVRGAAAETTVMIVGVLPTAAASAAALQSVARRTCPNSPSVLGRPAKASRYIAFPCPIARALVVVASALSASKPSFAATPPSVPFTAAPANTHGKARRGRSHVNRPGRTRRARTARTIPVSYEDSHQTVCLPTMRLRPSERQERRRREHLPVRGLPFDVDGNTVQRRRQGLASSLPLSRDHPARFS